MAKKVKPNAGGSKSVDVLAQSVGVFSPPRRLSADNEESPYSEEVDE